MKKYIKALAITVLVLAVAAGALFGIFYGIPAKEKKTDQKADKKTVISSEEILSNTGTQQTQIRLDGDKAVVTGSGAKADGSTVTISQAGSYSISGTLENGQIYVDAENEDTVVLFLSGADISNSSEAAIHVENAGQTLLVLETGTDNRVQSGMAAELSAVEDEEDENISGAAIYARDDLAITGDGALQVSGYVNNGIHTTNNLTIDSGSIEVTAKNNGIKGKDSVTITDGSFLINCGGDGIKSDDDTGEGYGVISISGGTFSIEAGSDGIQAETELEITDGTFSITSGGGSDTASYPDEGFNFNGGFGGMPHSGDDRLLQGGDSRPSRGGNNRLPQDGNDRSSGNRNNRPFNDRPFQNWDMDEEETVSTKGIKCGEAMRISGGSFSIDSKDDGFHSNGSITISGGTFDIASGDDGIHADTELTIEGGEILITKSYEGIEGNQVQLVGGNINITANDDGLNAYGGQSNWGPGGSGKATEEMPNLYITGANIVINADGDGIDSNGNIYVESGFVVVNGPSDSGNGALDSGSENGGACVINGGTVFAIGSSGMAETFGRESKQCSFCHNFSSNLSAGSEIVISDEQGNILFQHTVLKPASSVVFSCPDLETGKTYYLSVDDEVTDIVQNDISVTSGQQPRWGRW